MAGEDEDLLERERQAAEDRAFEQNPYGTGVDPDAPQEYDYEASPEATDVDYQPGDNGFSDEFTNHAGTDLYANQFGNHQDDDEAGEDAENADDDDNNNYEVEEEDEWSEDWDGDEEDEEDIAGVGKTLDDMKANQQKYPDGTVLQIGNRKYRVQHGGLVDLSIQNEEDLKKAEAKKKKKKRKGVKINWKPGDRITLDLLNQVWFECHKIKKAEPLIDAANDAIKTAIQSISTGSNIVLYIKAYDQFRQWAGQPRSDFIGTMLQMASRFGIRTTFATVSTVQAFFTQTWLDPLVISTLPATVEAALGVFPIKTILDKLFSIVVPILEDQETNPRANINAIQ